MDHSTEPTGKKPEVVSEYYENYKETQTELLQIYRRKTRNAIFTIAGLWLASDLLALAVANAFTTALLLTTLLVPAILIACAIISLKQPLLAITLAAIIFVGVWILIIVRYGGLGAISGILIKAIIIYFLISGFQSAREAEKIFKGLKNS